VQPDKKYQQRKISHISSGGTHFLLNTLDHLRHYGGASSKILLLRNPQLSQGLDSHIRGAVA
jgi:hypothetical protein